MISLPYARQKLRVSPEQDNLLEERIASVIEDFNQRTMTQWSRSEGATHTFQSPNSADKLFLSKSNVTVTGVRGWDRSSVYDGVDIGLVDDVGGGSVFSYRGGKGVAVLEHDTGWTHRFVQVTYDCGYDVCPYADMVDAILYQVQFLEERYGAERLVTESIAIDGASTRFSKKMALYEGAVAKYKVRLP
ncbi:MAG: hypothetical protein COA69_09410 [Robiginitomaculum sp.]|nr:MAG: hypothetical protein COA69_09410 [Robiginitomaculum sp.]